MPARGGRGHRPRRPRPDPLAHVARRGARSGGPGSPAPGAGGGHSRRRVAHAKDTTGREIERALLAACEARGIEDHVAIDLVTSGKAGLGGPNCVLGAYVLHRDTGDVSTVSAGATILATGGAGKVYLLHLEPRRLDGTASRWRTARRASRTWSSSSSPDLPVPPTGEELPHQRGAAREGIILRNAAGLARGALRRTRPRRATSSPARSTRR